MVVTRSWHARRLRDAVKPHFDRDVVHREVCTACGARFPVGADRVEAVLVGAPPPAYGDVAHDHPVRDGRDPGGAGSTPATARAASSADPDVPGRLDAGTVAAGTRDADRAMTRARQLAEAWAQVPTAQPVQRTRAESRLVVSGSRTPLGAGRRSGLVRRPVGGTAG